MDDQMLIRQPPGALRKSMTHHIVLLQIFVWILPVTIVAWYIVDHHRKMLGLYAVVALILTVLIDVVLGWRLSRGKRQLAVQYPRIELWEPPPEEEQGGAPLTLLQANLIGDVPVITEQGQLSRHRAQHYELMLTPGVFVAGVGVLSHRAGPSGTYGIQMTLCDHNMRRLVSDSGVWGAFFRYAVVRPGAYILELQCVAGQQLEFIMMHQHQLIDHSYNVNNPDFNRDSIIHVMPSTQS